MRLRTVNSIVHMLINVVLIPWIVDLLDKGTTILNIRLKNYLEKSDAKTQTHAKKEIKEDVHKNSRQNSQVQRPKRTYARRNKDVT